MKLGELSDREMHAAQLLNDDLVPVNRIVSLLAGCRKTGKDPVEFATHFIKLRAVALEK